MSLHKRSFPSSSPSTTAAATNDLRQRVISCLNKLSDRDTYGGATTELESIARNLTHDSFSPFLNCIYNTDSSCKSPVRKQCVNLLTLLSNSHGNSLSPFVSKMISTLTRRLRDPDSAVRSACVEATTAMSSQITKPPFSTMSKPLIELLTLEQDFNAQIGAALCLAAAIEAAPEPELEQLRKVLPRLGKLMKCEGFKAKAGLLSVIGSIVGAGGASSKIVLDWLVPFLVEFLSHEDWAARKAAAEALGKVALVEKELAKEHKDACLSSLESKRFDKVKAVRETMNCSLELWKEVSAVSKEAQMPSQSKSSSTDDPIGDSIPSASGNCGEVGLKSPLPKKPVQGNRSPPSNSLAVTTAKKQSPLKSSIDNSKRIMSHRMDHKKNSKWKIELALPLDGGSGDDKRCNGTVVSESGEDETNEKSLPETKYVLFSSGRESKVQKSGGLRSGSRVVPCNDDETCYKNKNDAGVNCSSEEFLENQKEIEDLSMIRQQLMQIEDQQSNLFQLLQRFIGSSQHGISSLETRVHGLERALDEISFDMALSTGRIPAPDFADNTCCKLPGADFLSSKFWRRTEGRYPTHRFSLNGGIQPMNVIKNINDKDAGSEIYNGNNQRSQHPNRDRFMLSSSTSAGRRNSDLCSSQMPNKRTQDNGQIQISNGISEASSGSRTASVN